MRSIAEEQDRIGWIHFTEERMTKIIRDMQTMYMCNRGSTYTENHWMRDFVKKTIGANTRAMAWAKSDEALPHRGEHYAQNKRRINERA